MNSTAMQGNKKSSVSLMILPCITSQRRHPCRLIQIQFGCV